MAVKYIGTWDEFKAIVLESHPDTIFYILQPHPLRNPPLGLRLTFYIGQDMYAFIDYANGSFLVKTGIPIMDYMDRVHAKIKEQDIRDFLLNNFPRIKLISLPPFMY